VCNRQATTGKSIARIVRHFDDGDGFISRDELARGVRLYLGKELNRRDLDVIFEHFDADHSGSIELSELVRQLAPKSTYELLNMKQLSSQEGTDSPINGSTSNDMLAARQPTCDASGMKWPSARDLSLIWGHAIPRLNPNLDHI